MRSLIAYLLLLGIMLPTISPLGTIVYFNSNRAYIARVLCKNRDKPALNCNGKCYLAKKLKQQQDQKDKETTRKIENLPNAHLFYQPFANVNFEQSFVFCSRISFVYFLNPYLTTFGSLLKPPRH